MPRLRTVGMRVSKDIRARPYRLSVRRSFPLRLCFRYCFYGLQEYRRWLCGREEWTANVYNAARQRGYETLPAYSNHGDASTTYVGGVEVRLHFNT